MYGTRAQHHPGRLIQRASALELCLALDYVAAPPSKVLRISLFLPQLKAEFAVISPPLPIPEVDFQRLMIPTGT